MSNKTKGHLTPYLINTANGIKRFRTKKRLTNHDTSLKYRWARYMKIGLMYNEGKTLHEIGRRFDVCAGRIRQEIGMINSTLCAHKHTLFIKGSESYENQHRGNYENKHQ